jgi:NadR type nicotinamide-nucleotide adenylyltransferase
MKKIAIIGPESTGKSTLCQQLAGHYDTSWCPEFARQYLQQYGTSYSYADLLTIAKGQQALMDRMAGKAKNDLYFVDTEMYVMKVWCEVVFETCHTWILKQAAKQDFDMFLLCNTDLPWVADDLREYPDPAMRQRLFQMYKDICVNSGSQWVEIEGTEDERFAQAVASVNRLIN